MPLPPRFGDTVQLRSQTQGFAANAPASPIAMFMQSPGSRWGSAQGMASLNECTKHYNYWNWVGIRAICNKFCQHMPNVGYPVKAKKSARQSFLSDRDRGWLKQRYGATILQSDGIDLKPAPDSHPLVKLLADVNPQDTFQEFAYEWMMYWQLCGKSYLWAIPNGFGLPAEIYVLPSDWVWPVYNAMGDLWKYKVIPVGYSAIRIDLPPEEVITCKFKSPRSKIDGWGPLQAGPLWVDSVESIEKTRKATFDGGPNPDFMFTLSEKFGEPGTDVITRIKEKFLTRTQGTAREPIVIPFGITGTKITNTPLEMDFGTSGGMTRDNNLALLGVPGIIAGLAHEFTEANADASMLVFCENTMNPLFSLAAGILTEHLATRYDDRLKVWYPDCKPENAEFKLRQMEAASPWGGASPADWQRYMGAEVSDLPAYNTGYIPANMVPIEPPEPDESDDLPVDPNAALPKNGGSADGDVEGDGAAKTDASENDDDPSDGDSAE